MDENLYRPPLHLGGDILYAFVTLLALFEQYPSGRWSILQVVQDQSKVTGIFQQKIVWQVCFLGHSWRCVTPQVPLSVQSYVGKLVPQIGNLWVLIRIFPLR